MTFDCDRQCRQQGLSIEVAVVIGMAAYGNSLQNWKPALERRGARGSTDRNALPVQVSRDELQREARK